MSSTSVEFCDTNVVVYAYDSSAAAKYQEAQRLLNRLWVGRSGALSLQVLQEVYVNLTRKLRPAYSPTDARAIISDLATWRSVVEPTRRDVIEAAEQSQIWGISFWDAMILVAARRAGALIVWSEDLSDGQSYDGIVVRNPFARSTPAA
jgi:predicted nucleic acid-binding protein